MTRPRPWPWLAAGAGYAALAIALTWPLALHLQSRVLGLAWVDQMDTAWLRLAEARGWLNGGTSDQIFAPTGYPLGALVPNHLDHLLATPLTLALPWPLADNLWWLLVIVANGLAAHVLGRRLGGSHAAGALCGVAFVCAEPLLRELNLSHAPQVLMCWAPLYIAAVVHALSEGGRWTHAALAGLFLALAGLSYWYQALFLVVCTLPVIAAAAWRGPDPRRLLARGALVGAVALAVVAVPLAVELGAWSDLPRRDATTLPDPGVSPLEAQIPKEHRWTMAQGADPLWPVRPTPLDRTNRLSVVLVGAALVGLVATRRERWRWLAGAGIAGTLLMGPYLKWGDDPVLVGGSPIPLPGYLLAEVSDAYGRLHWPQRWGLVVPLLLLPLAARVRRPWAWAALVGVETLVLSGNAPTATTPVAQLDGWRSLAAADGAILVLPLDRRGPYAASSGFIYRASGRPVATSLDLADGAPEPDAWMAWRQRSPFVQWHLAHLDGATDPLPAHAVDVLADDGISAIALDATPGGLLPRREVARMRAGLEGALGAPVDYGSAIVWWIAPPEVVPPALPDPDGWRAEREDELRSWSGPSSRTVFRPLQWAPR